MSDSATPWTIAHQAPPSSTVSQNLHKFVSIELVILSNNLVLVLFPSVFPSISVFSSELAFHIKWPKYWSFSFSPSNKYSGLISFRMDWLYLLAAQGTLGSLPQLFKNRVRSSYERSCHMGVKPSILVSSKCHMTCSPKILF